MSPSSSFAVSLKPRVAYRVLNLCPLWKKHTTLPSLAYAGIPYQVLGERSGALALTTACTRLAMARSDSGISAIFARTSLSPSALSARGPRRSAACASRARSSIEAACVPCFHGPPRPRKAAQGEGSHGSRVRTAARRAGPSAVGRHVDGPLLAQLQGGVRREPVQLSDDPQDRAGKNTPQARRHVRHRCVLRGRLYIAGLVQLALYGTRRRVAQRLSRAQPLSGGGHPPLRHQGEDKTDQK